MRVKTAPCVRFFYELAAGCFYNNGSTRWVFFSNRLKIDCAAVDNNNTAILEKMMSSDSITSLTNSISTNSTDQSIGIAVLKKALDSETAVAAALLDALPPVQRSENLPPNLGRTINTTA
jgi:hypothetical protein